jgi:hypothetical protein
MVWHSSDEYQCDLAETARYGWHAPAFAQLGGHDSPIRKMVAYLSSRPATIYPQLIASDANEG